MYLYQGHSVSKITNIWYVLRLDGSLTRDTIFQSTRQSHLSEPDLSKTRRHSPIILSKRMTPNSRGRSRVKNIPKAGTAQTNADLCLILIVSTVQRASYPPKPSNPNF